MKKILMFCVMVCLLMIAVSFAGCNGLSKKDLSIGEIKNVLNREMAVYVGQQKMNADASYYIDGGKT
jgi:hypothetical protein